MTTPMDIKKPDKSKYKKLNWLVGKKLLVIFFSSNNKIIETEKLIKLNIIFLNSKNLLFLLADFITPGIVPNINPIKQYLEIFGYELYNVFNMFPNRTTPIKVPRTIGKRIFEFVFISEKKLNIEFINFSYRPSETKITPLLIPGKIEPRPIKNPINIFLKKVINLILLSYFSINSHIPFL